MKAYDVIGWVYDADYHCPACAVKRFGEDERSPGFPFPWLPESGATDSEGNAPLPIFASDEWFDASNPDEVFVLYCADCEGIIDEVSA